MWRLDLRLSCAPLTEPANGLDQRSSEGRFPMVDANVPLDQVETMKQIVSGSVRESRFRTTVLGDVRPTRPSLWRRLACMA